jgi:adenosine deaminase
VADASRVVHSGAVRGCQTRDLYGFVADAAGRRSHALAEEGRVAHPYRGDAGAGADVRARRAQRRRAALPRPGGVAEGRLRLWQLARLLDIYYAACEVLRTREDIRDLTVAYLDRVALDNVRHVELFFDPQTHTARGVSIGTVIEGICDGLAVGSARHGISSYLIPNFLRHLSAEDAMRTLEDALPYRDRIRGWGLDSSEVGAPPSKFAEVFRAAQGYGFHTVMHAGEEGPPESSATPLRPCVLASLAAHNRRRRSSHSGPNNR